jgi:hypothetical protein
MAHITQKTWRDSLHTDMILSAVSVLVVALPSSEFVEGLMNYPAFQATLVTYFHFKWRGHTGLSVHKLNVSVINPMVIEPTGSTPPILRPAIGHNSQPAQ